MQGLLREDETEQDDIHSIRFLSRIYEIDEWTNFCRCMPKLYVVLEADDSTSISVRAANSLPTSREAAASLQPLALF